MASERMEKLSGEGGGASTTTCRVWKTLASVLPAACARQRRDLGPQGGIVSAFLTTPTNRVRDGRWRTGTLRLHKSHEGGGGGRSGYFRPS
jgi:hypothetical protein